MQTILVIGANGFVGTHTLKNLMQVSNINLIAACRDRSKLIPEFKGEIRQGDIRDDHYLDNLLQGVDVVCNTMSWTSLWSNRNHSNELYYLPTLKLIQKALNQNISRFINVSTTSAAAPSTSSDPMSIGIDRKFWPHLGNVIKIENFMRENANTNSAMINMRFGIFAGEHYGLSILPVLLPRLKTHLVPWVASGKTHLPIIDGRDIGAAMKCAAITENLHGYQSFNIVAQQSPTVRELINFIHQQFNYPLPHFSVPFFIAYQFAHLMEIIDPIVPWEPLITRSIVHLLEETNANYTRAKEMIAYSPQYTWQDAVTKQVQEMEKNQTSAMKLARPIV